jgi:uncharacterized protein (TIGR01244 family)
MAIPVRALSAHCSVAGQLSASDIATLVDLGFRTVINNRPDGEGGAAQPTNQEIESAVKAAGLHHVYLPVVSGAITPAQVLAMRELLKTAPGPVLAFCRSGARSAQLYSLAVGQ